MFTRSPSVPRTRETPTSVGTPRASLLHLPPSRLCPFRSSRRLSRETRALSPRISRPPTRTDERPSDPRRIARERGRDALTLRWVGKGGCSAARANDCRMMPRKKKKNNTSTARGYRVARQHSAICGKCRTIHSGRRSRSDWRSEIRGDSRQQQQQQQQTAGLTLDSVAGQKGERIDPWESVCMCERETRSGRGNGKREKVREEREGEKRARGNRHLGPGGWGGTKAPVVPTGWYTHTHAYVPRNVREGIDRERSTGKRRRYATQCAA